MKWLWWLLALVLLALTIGEIIWLYFLLFSGPDAFPTTEDRRTGIWVALGLGLLIYGAVFLLRRTRQLPAGSPRVNRKLERRILAYARKHGGRLTVAEVALSANTSVSEADGALHELVRQGVATVQYTPSMEPVYVIGGFDEAAQAQAQDMLNPPPKP